MLNGIFYVTKTGCQWRMLPLDFGHWNTIYSYFRAWRRTGLWARLLEQLRQRERRRLAALRQAEEGSRDVQGIGQEDKARCLPLKDRGDKALAASLRVHPSPPLWLDRVTWEEESQPPFSSLGAKAGREVPPGPQRTRAL